MFKFVGDVYVGAGATGTDIDALNINDIVVINEEGTVVTTGTAADAKALRVVKVVAKQNITLQDGTAKTVSVTRTSDEIKKEEIFTPEVYVIPYAPAVEEVLELDFNSAALPADFDRMVVRVVFKDTEGTKTQITKSFETVAQGAPLALATALEDLRKKINRNSNGALSATLVGNVLTITGMPKMDNEGLNSINEYSQYEFTASVFVTRTDSYLADQVAIPGLINEIVTPAFKGSGTAKLVRDAEKAMLPYQGNLNFICIPTGRPELSVSMDKTYDTIILEYNKLYRSSQDQFQETTPKKVEIYAEAGTGANIAAILEAFHTA